MTNEMLLKNFIAIEMIYSILICVYILSLFLLDFIVDNFIFLFILIKEVLSTFYIYFISIARIKETNKSFNCVNIPKGTRLIVCDYNSLSSSTISRAFGIRITLSARTTCMLERFVYFSFLRTGLMNIKAQNLSFSMYVTL